MALEDIIKNRVNKLNKIKISGIEPYPVFCNREISCKDAKENFAKLSKPKKKITLAGRIRIIRAHGGLTFAEIDDGTDKIQLSFQKSKLGEKGYKFFLDNFDVGDFIEARGILFKTKRGEKTLEVSNYKILSKSIRPLPEKWHGITDIEERFRKRYLDLIFNEDIRQKFVIRSQIINLIREFLEARGFMEVETPILQTIYGGATAKPFKTHLNTYNMDVFLRISPELYLKRLLVGGFEKVYEIGKCFRNEGVDKQHNPDFTMLEFYWAYATYKDLMRLAEEMICEILQKIFGKTKIIYQNKEIDFSAPWPRVEYVDLLKKYAKIDYWSQNRDSLAKKAKELEIEINKAAGKAEIADEIYKKLCRPKIVQPTFLIHYPAESKPLAKRLDAVSPMAANFQLVINGFEIVNAYSEQNDPIEQAKCLREQEEMFKLGFEEAQRSDMDFIEALEYGMPPAAGFGLGIDRLTALLTNSNSLREAILFPTMKKKE
ncbi:MAG: lysine--tRNA ligase [bacterium]|nr:lysine--tRNA ligase [bacterium]